MLQRTSTRTWLCPTVRGRVLCAPSTSGFLSGPQTTLKGQCFMSCTTVGSSHLRPIRRLTSYTVFRGLRATCLTKADCQHDAFSR